MVGDSINAGPVNHDKTQAVGKEMVGAGARMTSWLLWTQVRPILINGMLLVGSTALCLLAGEFVLRVLHSGDVRDHRLFTTYHPVLGWTKIPNYTGIHSAPEYRVT